jgi:hypothetical protein
VHRQLLGGTLILAVLSASGAELQGPGATVPSFAELIGRPVTLKPELEGVHPRVFVTAAALDRYRQRARNESRDQWQHVLADLPALKSAPPPAPGPQERRSQNNVAFAIAGSSLAWAIEQDARYLNAARAWTLAAIDYEPWGYTDYKPNVDLAAGHLLYAIGWAYDLLYHELTADERRRIRHSLERHAQLVYEHFSPAPGKQFTFTQNHTFIPTSGLAVAALALMGESPAAGKWASLARAHHHRANQLLSPDGYYYEGMEYWIFSIPWLVHFYDAWEHATGESLWESGPARNWKHYLAHTLLPDGQRVFDFGDIWEGPLTRAQQGAEFARVYPGGTLQSNYNVMYRVAARLKDPQAQAVAERYEANRHSNLEEYWTLLWRDPDVEPAAISELPLFHHFKDMDVVFYRTSWDADATAFAFKSGPPEGHRVWPLLPRVPEWRLDSGHAHPDAASFIIWARGTYLTGDTGYAGQPHARHHNTITVDGVGQGRDGEHDIWRRMNPDALDRIRIVSADANRQRVEIVADAASAYPAESGLRQFRRRFTFLAPSTFVVEDEISLAQPKPIEWYLQSDAPFQRHGTGYLAGDPPRLRVTIEQPANAAIATAPTFLTAPGKPGAITSGSRDQRGYHLRIDLPPAARSGVRVRLDLP